jgi:hypothetical protein
VDVSLTCLLTLFSGLVDPDNIVNLLNAQFRYLKERVVEFKDDCNFLCCDDKAKVPFGEPVNLDWLTRKEIIISHKFHTSSNGSQYIWIQRTITPTNNRGHDWCHPLMWGLWYSYVPNYERNFFKVQM